MARLLIVSLIIGIVLFTLWRKNYSTGKIKKSNIYKSSLIILILIVIIFIIASQGKLLLPKIFQIIKMVLPLFLKLIP